MKSSKSERKHIVILSPSSSSNRDRTSIQTDRLPLPRSSNTSAHLQVSSDPFREICKGIPNSKLKPILLKKRLSPCSTISLRPSLIRYQEGSSNQCLNLNKQVLPKLQFPLELGIKKIKKTRISLSRVKSERVLIPNIKEFDSQMKNNNKCLAESNSLEVSFGVQT